MAETRGTCFFCKESVTLAGPRCKDSDGNYYHQLCMDRFKATYRRGTCHICGKNITTRDAKDTTGAYYHERCVQ
jgi:hypothetical protein